jgi:hypothetical protein
MVQLNNTATHKYIFECFSSEDFNKLLHLFEDKNFIKEIHDNINDNTITININIIDKSGIYINILQNNNNYFHISFHLFPINLRQNSSSEGIFHIKNSRNKSITRLRLNKKCNITNKNKKTIVISIGRNPSRKASIRKEQKIITQKVLDVINKYFNSELSQYFRKIKTTQNHKILVSLTKHIKQNPYLHKISPKSISQISYINSNTKGLKGGACPCQAVPKIPIPLGNTYKSTGGYRATKRDLKYLKMWKQGKSIGFTMLSSLKSKGLIPRSNGTKRLGPKYRR